MTDGVFVPAADQAGCDAPPTFLPARPITQADLAALTERVRRRGSTGIATTEYSLNHKLRRAVTALAIGNIGKRRDAAAGGPGAGRATGGCCDAHHKPRSHDTSRIAWAKLMTRVGEEFPLECPNCGGDIRP